VQRQHSIVNLTLCHMNVLVEAITGRTHCIEPWLENIVVNLINDNESTYHTEWIANVEYHLNLERRSRSCRTRIFQ
jgi:hypothetical protein